jgi:hypothetical protein
VLTRQELAKRWKTTTRTVDRLRGMGLLPWQDLKKGIGLKPMVRFKIDDIEMYEAATPRRSRG